MAAAIAKKNNDINTFVWKGRKVEVNGQLVQEEKKLVDCSEKELRTFYNHCESMLYNDSKEYPGRYVLLDIIKDQRERCNTELFLRWLEQDRGIPRFTFLPSLRVFLDNNKGIDTKETFISEALVGDCPAEFARLPIDVVLEGCLDKLGKFNKQHITLTFILKQGLWFTQQESKDLTEKTPNGEYREKAEVARERLGLNPTANLYMTPKGLSFTQLRAMVNLKSKKYSELTTAQLETLRNRILFSLEDEVKFHINQWETRKNQIKMVCDAKGFTL
ncbi:MAG: hypothetical protein ACLU9M_06900 [Lachnospirales bacterium]